MYGCNGDEKCNYYFNEIKKFPIINSIFEKFDLYKNKAGQNGENLSGGQRQIINVINGLIIPSPICVLDEPTNSLDINLKNELIDLIKYFSKYKKSIIIISHDKDIFRIFDEKIIIK